MVQGVLTESSTVHVNRTAAQHSPLAAHYQTLVRRLHTTSVEAGLGQTIGIMSCARGAGVSTIAFNLAAAAAQANIGPVLLVDADVNNPPDRLVVPNAPCFGLVDAAAHAVDPMECVASSPIDNLSVVAGRGEEKGGESFCGPSKIADVLNEYKRHFKLLIIDIPAPTEHNGSVCLASQLDGVVLVIEAERADGRVALRTKQQLVDADANLLGVVFNKRRKYLPGWLYRLL